MKEQKLYDWENYFRLNPSVVERVGKGEVFKAIQQKYRDNPYQFLGALSATSQDQAVHNPLAAAIGRVTSGTISPLHIENARSALHPPPPTPKKTQDEINQEGAVNMGLWKETVDEVKAMMHIKRQLDCSYAEALRIVRENQGGEPYPEGDGDPF